nr:RecName: Full=Major capsid protein; Short=MCP [Human herpesvirus 6 (strain Uganda-1102)]AAA51531.1 major capsid protein [Human betaherpesvirus 6A]AAA65567.1 major capsid protein [Human betaherpesvirus 6A]
MENWQATEILPKIEAPLNIFNDIKTYTAEQLFDNLRIYFGDDPSRYNISFEALLGIYCNKIEWINFFTTPIAVAANVIRFNDVSRMTLGKVLFFIQLPRVATGNDVTASKETTIMVAKHSEKHPINISFDLSAACLEHLENTFKNTVIDQILNINALHTVLRSLKNSADSLERGLIHAFMQTLLRKSPPQFIVLTMNENKVHNKQALSRVQRSNMFQSLKNRLLTSLFFLNRNNNISYIYRILNDMMESVTESILNDTNNYTSKENVPLDGVLLGPIGSIQKLTSILSQYISTQVVSAPISYGHFIMGKENAVTAIAYRAIMADFTQFTVNAGTEQQDTNNKSEIFDKSRAYADLKLNTLKLGDKLVAFDHLHKVYKNTDVNDPLEQSLQLTFFFPLGIYIPSETGFSTMETRVKLNDTMENNLPTSVFFHNKDQVVQRIDFADILPSVCHPIVHDSTIVERLMKSEPLPTGHRFSQLCQLKITRENPARILQTLYNLYESRQEVPKNTNVLKNELNIEDFYKPDNPTLPTERHPFFDLTYIQKNRATEVLCTPRIMIGNIPLPLAPVSFHEARTNQILEHAKTNCQKYDFTLKIVTESLTSGSYPELAYVIETLVHGNKHAFMILKQVISQCISYWFNMKHILLFCNSFEMIMLISNHMGDELIPGAAFAHYRNLVSLIRLVKRTISISNLNEQLCGEPLVNFANALFDGRLFCPFVHTMPRNDTNAKITADDTPLTQNTVRVRNYEISDVQRMNLIDSSVVFTDNDRPSNETTILSKIFYFCVLPALSNNKACGAGVNVKELVLDLFYTEPFISPDDYFQENPITSDVLMSLIREGMGPGYTVANTSCIAKQLFKSLIYINENTKILEVEVSLDPAQRHGNSVHFQSLQHILYNGLCLISPITTLRRYYQPIPFHRFFSDPGICGTMNADIQVFLNTFPHCQRNDGGFPLPPPLALEFYNWQRTPFSVYSAFCPNSLLSIMTLAAMHSKLSPVAIAIQSKNKIHPGFAATLVRTDNFDVECLLYSSRAATSIILDDPTVTAEAKDIATTYNFTQHLSFVDMGLGFSSTTATANLKRIKSDMGSKIQNLFSAFPIHAFTNADINTWIRHHVGIEKPNPSESEALNIITFGGINKNPPSILLHGQQAICEVILTPVTTNINFFKSPHNPRGRESCMMGTDPHNEEAARKALYDHTQTDSDTFAATTNPWASLPGSLGDILYNTAHREQLCYNPKTYSPNAQFFTESDILKTNKMMYKVISEYCMKSNSCLNSDSEIQYSCSEGTDSFVSRPCQFLQNALPLHCSSNQALLESRSKTGNTQISETHYCNYAIGETIPFQLIIESSI